MLATTYTPPSQIYIRQGQEVVLVQAPFEPECKVEPWAKIIGQLKIPGVSVSSSATTVSGTAVVNYEIKLISPLSIDYLESVNQLMKTGPENKVVCLDLSKPRR